MTDDSSDRPLRLTSTRSKRGHAAGVSRRLVFGVSCATAAALTSTMADAASGKASFAEIPPTTSVEPLVIHIQRPRTWATPAPVAPTVPDRGVRRIPSQAPRPDASQPQSTQPQLTQSAPTPQATPPSQPTQVTPPRVTTAAPRTPPTTQSRAS